MWKICPSCDRYLLDAAILMMLMIAAAIVRARLAVIAGAPFWK